MECWCLPLLHSVEWEKRISKHRLAAELAVGTAAGCRLWMKFAIGICLIYTVQAFSYALRLGRGTRYPGLFVSSHSSLVLNRVPCCQSLGERVLDSNWGKKRNVTCLKPFYKCNLVFWLLKNYQHIADCNTAVWTAFCLHYQSLRLEIPKVCWCRCSFLSTHLRSKIMALHRFKVNIWRFLREEDPSAWGFSRAVVNYCVFCISEVEVKFLSSNS